MSFIVFEGIDGSGKSSAIKAVSEVLSDAVIFSEPTRKGPYGIEIRRILQSAEAKNEQLDKTFLELFRKDRLWDLQTNILPALKQKKTVLLDRYYFSTAAYQADSTARSLAIVDSYLQDEEILPPDLVFYFDITVEVAMQRIGNRAGQKEVFDEHERLAAIRDHYLAVFQEREYSFRVEVIDAAKEPQQVVNAILAKLQAAK